MNATGSDTDVARRDVASPWLTTRTTVPRRPAAASHRAATVDTVDARVCEDDDAALVARCAHGDGAAWSALVHRYQRLVYAIVLRMGLDEHGAADVFQTVFARLVQHLPRIADPSRLQAWIVTTAKREALLQRKLGLRNVSMTRADDGHEDATADWDMADESPIAEEALDELQQLNQLRVALDRLDQRCRDLLLLLFREDDDKVSYEDVARRLSTSVGSIGPTRSRCLDKLRRSVS
jgi:RNA polymerase sigma factor (sigma-70 family)